MTNRLTFLLFATLAAGCASSDDRPNPVPRGDAPSAKGREVRPEIERWFRDNAPSSGLRIVSGDRISISVQGHGEMAVTRDIPPNGAVPVYDTDKTINALGKTVQQIESEVADAYTVKYAARPYVTVSIVEEAPRSIYVYGGVRAPGSFSVGRNAQLTVLKAITLAGGGNEEGDLHAVTVQRIYPSTGETVSSPPLDIAAVVDGGNLADNLIVEAGDLIVVPSREAASVQVLGKVERQGSVKWHDGMTLAEAITESGGFGKFAKKSSIRVVRHGSDMIVVNWDDIMEHRMPDLPLRPRDVIFVDERFF